MVGSWYSDTLTPDTRSGGSRLTGPGPASQSKQSGLGAGYDPGPAYTPSVPSGSTWADQLISRPNSWTGQALSAARDAQNTAWSVGGGTSKYSSLANAQALANSYYGPQQEMLANNQNLLRDQYGMVQGDVGYRQGALQRDTDLARQGLGLDRQAIGVDRNLTNTQLANLARLQGILGQQFGLNDKDLAVKLRQLGMDETQLKDTAKRQQWDLRSNLTARGAFHTIANERGTGRINRDLGYGLFGIGTQREQAKLGHEGSKLGLQEKGIGYENQAAGMNATLQKLGIDTQRLGLSDQQLSNSLQDGLRQIGLDGILSLDSIQNGIDNGTLEQKQLLTEIYNFVAGLQGLPLAPAPTGTGKTGGGNKGPGYEL